MLDVLIKTKFNKINEEYDPKGLKAGILYDSKGYAIDKILFYENNGCAIEVWNDIFYSLDKSADYYIDNIVCLGDLFIEFFGYNKVNFYKLLMGYKMFLNDSNYLYRHLDEFNMVKMEIGYKSKSKIVPDPYCYTSRQFLFQSLLTIINYESLNKKENEKNKRFKK